MSGEELADGWSLLDDETSGIFSKEFYREADNPMRSSTTECWLLRDATVLTTFSLKCTMDGTP